VKPCDHCYYMTTTTRAACSDCKHAERKDHFEPVRLCASCQYDPRWHGVCAGCVDYDKYHPGHALGEGEQR
jgi:hypothetical protein